MEKKKKIFEIIKKVLTIASYIITGIVLLCLIVGGVNSCHSNNEQTINDTNAIEKLPKKSLVFNGDDLLEQDRLLMQGDNYVLPLTTFYSYRTHLFTSVEIRDFAINILYNTSDNVDLVMDLKIYQDLSVIYEFDNVNGINLVRTEMRIFYNNGEDYQDIYLEDTGSADYQLDISIISYDVNGGLTGLFEIALLAVCPYMYYQSLGSNTLIRAQSTFYPVYQITFENTITQNILIGQFGFNDTDYINYMTFNGSSYNLLLYQLQDLDFVNLILKSTIQAHKLKDNEYYYNIYDYFTNLETTFRYLNYFSTTYNGLVMCKQFMYFNGISNYDLNGVYNIGLFNSLNNNVIQKEYTLESGQGVETILNSAPLNSQSVNISHIGLYNGSFNQFVNEFTYIKVWTIPMGGFQYEYYNLKLNITYGIKNNDSNFANKIYTIGVDRVYGASGITEETEQYYLSGINVNFFDLWKLHERKSFNDIDRYPIKLNFINTQQFNFISKYITPTSEQKNVVIVPTDNNEISFFDIFGIAFANVSVLFGYTILPGITLGFLLFFPFVLTIILFIINLFKR